MRGQGAETEGRRHYKAENFRRLQQRLHEAYSRDCFFGGPFPQQALKDKRQDVSGRQLVQAGLFVLCLPKLRGSMFQKVSAGCTMSSAFASRSTNHGLTSCRSQAKSFEQ
jgi:hypothetical protein